MIFLFFDQGYSPGLTKLSDTGEQHTQVFFNPNCSKSYVCLIEFVLKDRKTVFLS